MTRGLPTALLRAGTASTAFGTNTTASGAGATAMGESTTASAFWATAMGFDTTAAGQGSTVMGLHARATAAAPGSFVYGDSSTTFEVVQSISPNQFLVRAAGGTAFWSTAATTYPTSPGVILYYGDSAWSSLSDVNANDALRVQVLALSTALEELRGAVAAHGNKSRP